MRSFAEIHPELIPEWSEKNVFDPDEISYGSNKKVWWRGACGHEWEATVKNRGNDHGCPYCSGNKVLTGFNDLAFHHPELVQEWSDLNFPEKPEDFTKRSTHYAVWKCRICGHQWKARIADRSEGHGCPVCAGEKLVPGVNDFEKEHPELAEEWSEKNDQKPSEIWSRSRENVLWKCKKCGNLWKGVVNSRVKGKGCPVCEKRKRPDRRDWQQIKRNAVQYYLKEEGIPFAEESEDEIGIPISIYMPDLNAAIEVSLSGRRCRRGRKWENGKNWLCFHAGIRLIRILKPKEREYVNCICITRMNESYDAFSLALDLTFQALGISSDIDVERDWFAIRQGVA